MTYGIDWSRFSVLRRGMKMSQSQLSDLAGITQGKLSKIEAGKANPQADTLHALCAALDAELVLVPRRISGDVKNLVDNHLGRHAAPLSQVMSVRDELFIPDGD